MNDWPGSKSLACSRGDTFEATNSYRLFMVNHRPLHITTLSTLSGLAVLDVYWISTSADPVL